MSYSVRLFGDPVLRQRASEITDIDGRIARMATDMLPSMQEAGGIGLAAPQVGILKRLFVYDMGEGPETLVNPRIKESDGEWTYEEGCLSLPGMSFEIVRPKQVHLVGFDLDGNEVSIEADELLARLFQHELDHLDGVLTLDLLDRDTRKQALTQWRQLRSEGALPSTPMLKLDQTGGPDQPDQPATEAKPPAQAGGPDQPAAQAKPQAQAEPTAETEPHPSDATDQAANQS